MPPWSKNPTPLNILVCGDAQVGKTCFIDMFLEGKHFIQHPITDPLTRTLTMENSQYTFSLMDLNVTASVSDDYRVIMDAYIAGADGIILLYDVTNRDSFDRVTNETYVHIWGARNTVFRKQGDTGKMEGLKKRFGCVVVGNKSDLVGEDEAKRRIENGEAGDWAESQGFRAFEVSSNERVEVEDVVKALVKSVRKVNWMDDQDDRDSRDAGKGSDSKRSVGALLKKALGGVK